MKLIVSHMAKRLNTKKNLKRMFNTNKLLPLGSLKRKCVKKFFSGWVLKFVGNGRILTYKLASDVCKRLRKMFQMEKPGDLHEETKRMHALLKAARKRQLGKNTLDNLDMSMDELETVPMFANHMDEESGFNCRAAGSWMMEQKCVPISCLKNSLFLQMRNMEIPNKKNVYKPNRFELHSFGFVEPL